MDKIIEKLGPDKPRLLLHSCCGPCSSSVLEELSLCFKISLLWYNPNLYPQEEFQRRYEAQLQIINALGLEGQVELITEPRQHRQYLDAVEGLEQEREGGIRCAQCFRLRLEHCARLCREGGYDWFCTTLTVSRHKNAKLINALGEDAAARYGVRWLPSDFKKRNGENRSQELAARHGIYRQLYCGCEFSLNKPHPENSHGE